MPPGDRGRPPPGVAANRALNRNSPLTPKVAGKGSPVIGTMARRPQTVTPTLASHSKEDISSPVSAFIASNVTPRTGHRQVRLESANTTPGGTPNPDRNSDGWETAKSGLGISLATTTEAANDAGDSKFFYASDARSQQTSPSQKSTPQQRPTTFFYANGAGPKRTSPPTNNQLPMSSTAPDSITSKFFYANGTPDVVPTLNLPGASGTSTVSSSSRMAPSVRPTSSYSTPPAVTPMRPVSPIKANSTPMAPSLRTAMAPTSPNRGQAVSPPTLGSNTDITKGKRRVSIDAPPKLVRGNSLYDSTQSSEPTLLPTLTVSPNASDGTSPPLSPGLSQTSMTMASLLHMAESLDEIEPGMQSPTKSQFSDSGVNELVANARRERKVQDLEITNASLEAINRTLERQLRKQTAELRRFRRLSRSGRLSLTSMPNSRVVSEALTDPAVDLSELSEEEEEESEEEDDLDSLDGCDVSMPGSPSDSLSPALIRRKRDEIRLQLDLSKHQELLIDSQKMNQSIKRCLNWTEVLIKEGQKALDYTVRVSDVEFGGRVLAPHLEEDEVSYQEEDTVQTTDSGLEPPWSKGAQDRDSGIELRQADPSQ